MGFACSMMDVKDEHINAWRIQKKGEVEMFQWAVNFKYSTITCVISLL